MLLHKKSLSEHLNMWLHHQITIFWKEDETKQITRQFSFILDRLLSFVEGHSQIMFYDYYDNWYK